MVLPVVIRVGGALLKWGPKVVKWATYLFAAKEAADIVYGDHPPAQPGELDLRDSTAQLEILAKRLSELESRGLDIEAVARNGDVCDDLADDDDPPYYRPDVAENLEEAELLLDELLAAPDGAIEEETPPDRIEEHRIRLI